MLVEGNFTALKLSVVITLLALAVFGALKGKLVGTGWLRSALQTITMPHGRYRKSCRHNRP